MSFYRKIDVGIWNDNKFISLSLLSKMIFVMLITHPHMSMPGAMRATLPGLAAELQTELSDFVLAFEQLLAKGMVKHDSEAHCIWLPNFVRYQSAASPNVITNWVKQLEFIPECDLKQEVITALEVYAQSCGEGYLKAFHKAFAKAFPESVNNKQKTEKRCPSQVGVVAMELGGVAASLAASVEEDF